MTHSRRSDSPQQEVPVKAVAEILTDNFLNLWNSANGTALAGESQKSPSAAVLSEMQASCERETVRMPVKNGGKTAPVNTGTDGAGKSVKGTGR